jgi:hypothetical protein
VNRADVLVVVTGGRSSIVVSGPIVSILHV